MYEEVASMPLLKFAWTRSRVAFVLIHLFSIITIAVSEGNLWALGIIAGVQVIFWVGNYKHRERLRKMPSNPNNHQSDVIGEGTEFPVMREPYGAPIMNRNIWMAARYEITIQSAMVMWSKGYERYDKEYNAYLSDKRFDKFRK